MSPNVSSVENTKADCTSHSQTFQGVCRTCNMNAKDFPNSIVSPLTGPLSTTLKIGSRETDGQTRTRSKVKKRVFDNTDIDSTFISTSEDLPKLCTAIT